MSSLSGSDRELPSSRHEQWWRHATVYEVYVRSFSDSDGDGIGDLPGIRDRLPYLKDLGVDAIWLTPFYRSPQADHGYDISDHCSVDPLFGTNTDFDALVSDAHTLGLKIIIDIIPNHVSEDHPWFRAAITAGSGDPARKRFHFQPGRGADGHLPPNNWESNFGGPAWTQLPDGEWYLHLFAPEQPDLNWEHPDIPREFARVLRYWLDRGVDGIRVDSPDSLTKEPGYPPVGRGRPHPYSDREQTHDVYREWRRILDQYQPPRMAVAETYGHPESTGEYVRPGELHQAFALALLEKPWSATAVRQAVGAFLNELGRVSAGEVLPVWVLGSHDVVRASTRWPHGGAAAMMLTLLALPGAVYLYQGDELGLPQVDLPDHARRDPAFLRSGGTEKGRDGARVPLPWSGGRQPYDFSPPHASGSPWLPQPDDWQDLTAECQSCTLGSALNLTRQALVLRRKLWQTAGEQVRWLPAAPGSFAFARDEGATCVMNLSKRWLRLDRYHDRGEVVLSSRLLNNVAILPPATSVWLASSARGR